MYPSVVLLLMYNPVSFLSLWPSVETLFDKISESGERAVIWHYQIHWHFVAALKPHKEPAKSDNILWNVKIG